MQTLRRSFKARLLMLMICAGALTPTRTNGSFTFNMTCKDHGLVFAGLVAGVALIGCGIAAICGAFRWSDEDILVWIRDGMQECDRKYQQLNNYNGSPIQRLQLFGNRHKASWSFCSSEADEVARDNPNLAPLHNAHLIISQDIKTLHDYLHYLLKRNLMGSSQARTYHTRIVEMINNLERLKDVLLSSPEYTHEEQAIQKKIHQLRQERLDRERNEALREQAKAQKEQARKPQDQTTNIFIFDN